MKLECAFCLKSGDSCCFDKDGNEEPLTIIMGVLLCRTHLLEMYEEGERLKQSESIILNNNR